MEKLITEFSIGLFFWQTIIFILLIFLLKKFAWKPILDAVNEREEGIKNALLSAEKAKEEMASLQSDNEETLKKARSERDSLLKEAREIKQQLIDEAKNEAKNEAKKIISQAQETIQNEKNAAIVDLKNQVASLSIDIAEKVLKEKLSDDQSQMNLVKDLVKEVTLK
ncbi:F0F1 ATP synthase subunit B [Flavobacteriaceae bacterium]|jgi:F-type H+-transporting ATPase subunit b|nr:F0F1 ATP synthase subunit B [Flavobacteriaceae bacterium]MDB4163584.1 F0F1 ATP synthase subunit B [Flavobacteriaceae bacterium]MDC1336760.1 F0F1 ATP synthase subunit B [Flavobacteriaceae bacterium]MDC1337728.1 F0F1 ATP synthase subunit B [Flavobacteriaceae bacterium]MDC3348614.1 F0F1 ATP synthase subunit B [Flavobacteriaceae bacterium]|tara:strand:- start:3008 stop:3508 length:501 start_codon:yes stop_codon:yes gene_type:complete